MNKVIEFVKKHIKKFVGGLVTLIVGLVTFGLIKLNNKKEE